MSIVHSKNNDRWKGLPDRWQSELAARLRIDESLLAWFEPDLDAQMRYGLGLVALTDRRLISMALPAGGDSPVVFEWTLDADRSLRVRDQMGVGVLEWITADRLLAEWRFTTSRTVAARGLASRLEELRREGQGEQAEPEEDATNGDLTCPVCGEVLPADRFSCPKCSKRGETPARSLFRLFGFVRPWLGMTLLGLGLMLASTAASLVPPYLTISLMDDVLVPYQNGQDVDTSRGYWLLTGLVGAAVLAWLLGWARTYVLAWVSERISGELRNRVYEHLHQLSLDFFGAKRTGDLISRVSSDTDRLNYFLSVWLLDFANDLVMLTMTALIVIQLDPFVALATLCPMPIIAWLVHKVRGHLRRGYLVGWAAWGEMTAVLADTIPGIRVVKAFAQGKREIQRFRHANDRVLRANDRTNKLWSFFGPTVVFLTDLGVVVVWVVGVWRILGRHLGVGKLTAFVDYIRRFYARVDSMSRTISAVQRAAASAHRIFEILDRVPTVAEPARPVALKKVRGEIDFRGIGFRYGNRPVLEGLDLSIREGEMIGLVGPSGAGKTTLVNLLCRFYDVTEGAILVDGADIRSFTTDDYRRHIGLVLQEPFLFYGTIAENIAYGRPDATRQEIMAAARAARAHEFILRQPDGYDSLVAERGQSLSGGERQRISIARALLIDPRILILDEATSSVDTETEREIQIALENLIQGRTTIAIAHRLSTLRRADRLVVIERGKIVEVGPHAQLVDAGGVYSRLYRAQLELGDQAKSRPVPERKPAVVSLSQFAREDHGDS